MEEIDNIIKSLKTQMETNEGDEGDELVNAKYIYNNIEKISEDNLYSLLGKTLSISDNDLKKKILIYILDYCKKNKILINNVDFLLKNFKSIVDIINNISDQSIKSNILHLCTFKTPIFQQKMRKVKVLPLSKNN